MDSVFAIGVGLALRLVVDVVSNHNDRVGGTLIGLWEGVVLQHFATRMPRSYDPYIAFGFRIFVDFLFTESLERLAIIILWTGLGALLADVSPGLWRDSGLRRLYRRARKDVRSIKRSVHIPNVRIKNDLPSVRLFASARDTPTVVSSSARSTRAAPAVSPAPPAAPFPAAPRRAGRSPPGTFPDTSGWSETETEVTTLRDRVVVPSGPSPALIPSSVDVELEYVDVTRARTPRAHAPPFSGADVDTPMLFERTEDQSDPSRHNPPMIPDHLDHPATPNRPYFASSFSREISQTSHQRTSTIGDPNIIITSSTPPRNSFAENNPPETVFTPRLETLTDIPDFDGFDSRRAMTPRQIPLPETRASSVVGGIQDARSAWRESVILRAETARSEVEANFSRPLTPSRVPLPTSRPSHSRPNSISGSILGSAVGSLAGSIWPNSKLKHSEEFSGAETPKPEADTKKEKAAKVKRQSVDLKTVEVSTVETTFFQNDTISTKAGPASIAQEITQETNIMTVNDTINEVTQDSATKPEVPEPIIKAPSPRTATSIPLIETLSQAAADMSISDPKIPMPVPQIPHTPEPVASSSQQGFLETDQNPRTPPPPFSEFVGVDQPAEGDQGVGESVDPQPEFSWTLPPTELTDEQRKAEEARVEFLKSHLQTLEAERNNVQENGSSEQVDEVQKKIEAVKQRMSKVHFSDAEEQPMSEIAITGMDAQKAIAYISQTLVDLLLQRDDAGPVCVQATINKQKPLKKPHTETKKEITSFIKGNHFVVRFEAATPGVLLITA
ncbi:hypothetical protein BJ138DRAFT_1146480 [Hygrophoropsis aurantiaca]|uniref:Uncharacterized protein n=1 Tax=Hygrophoropsis aurantiaca TaxID=72124 RepID=A0ACB8AI90_9AGAM|nr:hypothetical protein BJ138DRAFT_1146480 [Hygrophoropsis aurantiaca]